MTTEELMENLILSLVSVNNYSLEKSYQIKDNLKKEGLFDLSTLNKSSYKELFEKLSNSGYQKSDYVKGLITNGLKDTGTKLDQKNLEKLIQAVNKKDFAGIDKILLPIKGIGPYVVNNFCILCGIK